MDDRDRPADARPPRWQEDFPVRWEDDHYLTRRELTKFLTLGSGLLVATNAVVAALGRRLPEASYPAARIESAEALGPGQSLLFRYPTAEDPCILIRTRAGEWRAYSQVCTHLACAVVHRPADEALFCPCHVGWFAEDDGRPTAGPPERRLPHIRLDVREDGIYAVGVDV